jgi:hypothetical protein
LIGWLLNHMGTVQHLLLQIQWGPRVVSQHETEEKAVVWDRSCSDSSRDSQENKFCSDQRIHKVASILSTICWPWQAESRMQFFLMRLIFPVGSRLACKVQTATQSWPFYVKHQGIIKRSSGKNVVHGRD